jgi:alpha-glucuronidase
MHQPVATLAAVSAPRIKLRLLDHWDNLDRSVERGYAGKSLWEWDSLPSVRSPRYRDYARANASLGINGTVVTNVNANATALTAPWLSKVAALADEFRPYALVSPPRFSAVEIGGCARPTRRPACVPVGGEGTGPPPHSRLRVSR